MSPAVKYFVLQNENAPAPVICMGGVTQNKYRVKKEALVITDNLMVLSIFLTQILNYCHLGPSKTFLQL